MTRLIENSLFSYEIVEDVQGRPLRVGGEMQLADRPNLNRRKYPESLWTRVLGSGKTQTRLKERRMLGLLDHPADGKTKLEWPGPSHVMTHLEMKDSKRFPGTKAVYGVYECLPTPSGKVLEALLRSGVGIQVSSRGDGDLEEGNDGYSTVIPESYDLDTFDVVIDPSVNTDVRVLESQVPGLKIEVDESCSCKVPQGKTHEAIVRAIHSIVESKNYDESCRKYYTQVLESALPSLDSATYLMADEALSNLKEVSVTKTENIAEAQTSTVMEQLRQENERLRAELGESKRKHEAGVKTVEALLVQSRNWRMQAEHAIGKLKNFEDIDKKYESAKVVIKDLKTAVESLEKDGEKLIATESLLAALVHRINESKRRAYSERLLANESVKTRNALRPLLQKCGSRREVNETLIAHKKAISEARSSRGLPPINESGKRAGRLTESSPIMDDKGKLHTGKVADRKNEGNEVRVGGQPLSEQVNFTKKLVKSSR